MILTVTINPLLERRFKYSSINIGGENRNGKEGYNAGGKGINVSRQLNKMNVDNLAFTFTGGNNGKIFREVLIKENLKVTTIKTKAETRDAAVIIDESAKSLTTYFGQNSIISTAEVDEFKEKLEKMIQNCEIVVFAGSSPCKETDSIFPYGIELAKKYDKISLCDTYGNHLQNCIEAGPTIVHNNISEIEKSLNISLATDEEKLNYLNSLYEKNIKQAFLTNGDSESFASNFNYHFKVNNPKIETIDSTGSGDSFTAGIVYAWHNNLTFEESLKIASALGTKNALRYDVCNVSQDEIESLKNEIKVSPIGKKMKTLDVTPR